MKIKGVSMFNLVASVSVCGLLLSVSGAGAATEKQGSTKNPSPSRCAAGPLSETRPPFMNNDTTQAYCESDCCWATGEDVSCNNSSCTGSGEGGTAIFICGVI
jgi:hypothetical protein